MNDYRRHLASDAFMQNPLEASLDGELVLHVVSPTAILTPAPGEAGRFLSHLIGWILYGRSFKPMAELMTEAVGHAVAGGSKNRNIMIVKAMRHARFALRHAVLARSALLMLMVFCTLVATVVLAHETRNTESIYQNYLANPNTARAPQQSWGYTPVLYDLPENVKSSLIAFDRFVESGFRTLGLGRNKSASSSVQSLKLSAAIMSLFGLIPLVQFGLGQAGKARSRSHKAVQALASARSA
jgi:hypothetical protein